MLRKKYGISLYDYNRMLESQKGCCAICGGVAPGRYGVFAVDHDHDTGEIRALLCDHCNVGLGNFHEDKELLTAAIQYLEKHHAI